MCNVHPRIMKNWENYFDTYTGCPTKHDSLKMKKIFFNLCNNLRKFICQANFRIKMLEFKITKYPVIFITKLLPFLTQFMYLLDLTYNHNSIWIRRFIDQIPEQLQNCLRNKDYNLNQLKTSHDNIPITVNCKSWSKLTVFSSQDLQMSIKCKLNHLLSLLLTFVTETSQELTRVNPERNIFSINLFFYSTEVWSITITEF